tara:strand:+ start:4569 stop:5153 length:585 start_codon:yes stop_codon:yes gene_type:complete
MSNNIHTKLLQIQSTLVAPKGQNNAFGNYKFRSLEDILKAVKPLLNKVGMTLTISDEIKQIADRIYVTATATLTDIGTGQAIEAVASARESLDKKGMDSAQITGAASSYARKYCLNGLFCIDDTKDVDTMDNSYYQSQLHIIEFGELNDHPAMEGKRKAIKDAWKACSSDDDSEKVLSKMKATIIAHEEKKEVA